MTNRSFPSAFPEQVCLEPELERRGKRLGETLQHERCAEKLWISLVHWHLPDEANWEFRRGTMFRFVFSYSLQNSTFNK
jgi:hypothetical protein